MDLLNFLLGVDLVELIDNLLVGVDNALEPN